MKLSRRSILVVDDDSALRSRLVRALQRRGFQAEGAADAEAARLRLGTNGAVFDAAVVDLNMPGENGLDLVRWMARQHPTTRVLILTGYGSIATAVQAIQLGASDYLTKPADADQILRALFKEQVGCDSDGMVRESGGQVGMTPAPELPAAPRAASLDRVEWEHLQRVLSDCGGNISAAARVLGIERRTLQRKLAKHPPAE